MDVTRYFCVMPIRIFLFTLLLFVGWNNAHAAWLRGTVKDIKGTTIPGVWVGIENKSQRAITDVNGKFEFKLPNGKYVIQLRCIGYMPFSQEILIQNNDQTIELTIIEEANELSSLLISSDRSDFAKYLMDKAKET